MNLCMEFYMELVRILYGYLFGGLEYLFFFCVESLFGMVVWFSCGPQWRTNLYRENVRFQGRCCLFF